MNKIFSLFKLEEKPNLKELLRSGGITSIFKLVSLFLAYFVMIIITNTFGSEVFGRYSISIIVSQFILLIFTFGFPTVIVRLITDSAHFENHPKTNFMKKILGITLLSSIFISFSLFKLSEFIAIQLFHDEILKDYLEILSLFMTPLMFHEVLLNFFRGKKEYKKYNLFMFIFPPLFFIIFFYILYIYYQNETVVVLSFGLSIALVFIIELFFYDFLKISKKPNFPVKKLFKLAFPMMFSSTILFLLNWTDILMLGAMVSSKEVGIYNVAFKIASIGMLVIVVLNVVIGPKLGELYAKNHLISLQELVVRSTQIITILSIPLFLIIIIFRIEILSYFGEEFIQGETVLVILSLGIFINVISGNVDQILNMTDNQVIMRNLSIFCLVENIFLNAILIPDYGIIGAAVSSLITNFSLNVLSVFYIKRRLGFYTFIKK